MDEKMAVGNATPSFESMYHDRIARIHDLAQTLKNDLAEVLTPEESVISAEPKNPASPPAPIIQKLNEVVYILEDVIKRNVVKGN